MTRWEPGSKQQLLQQIANDERRPTQEREAARRELGTSYSKPHPYRRGRNANVPPTQVDIDSDIELSYRHLHDPALTSRDRLEIEQGLEESTQAIISAFGSRLIWLFGNNAEELRILMELYGKTQSDFVRDKAAKTIKWIADWSPDSAIKLQAQQYLTQLDTTKET
jgi:hypothetical protein